MATEWLPKGARGVTRQRDQASVGRFPGCEWRSLADYRATITLHFDVIGVIDLDDTAIHIVVPLLSVIAGAIAGAWASRVISKPYEARMSKSLARLQDELASERDERKSLRDRFDSQDLQRFQLLLEKRAQVMSETYAALCDLEEAYSEFNRSFMGFVGGPGPKDRWEGYMVAGEAFRKAFWPHRILFDEKTRK